jgi:hypothetical protein
MKTATTNQTKSENAMDKHGISLFAQEIVEQSTELNELFEEGDVQYAFRTHYVDSVNEVYGLEQMMVVIMTTLGASNPDTDYYRADDHHADDHPMRAIAIGNSVYADEIIAMVRATFAGGEERYPNKSIREYLSGKKKMKNVRSIRLTGDEDQPRHCPVPRCKYYIAE